MNGDAPTVREIAALYVSESQELVSRLGRSIELRNAEGIRSAAHRLRGAMLAVGAGAASMAADLEELAQGGKLDACRERFTALEVKAKALDEALIARELGGVPPPRS